MSLFPPIQRPCPYIDRLDSVMEGDFCRMCRREVHDLTAMDDAARAAFLAACGGDACVRYTLNVKPAVAAALIAASVAVAVVPAGAEPRGHPARRVPHPPRQVPVQTVPIMTGGLPVPVVVAGGLPVPQRPPEPVRPSVGPETLPPAPK